MVQQAIETYGASPQLCFNPFMPQVLLENCKLDAIKVLLITWE